MVGNGSSRKGGDMAVRQFFVNFLKKYVATVVLEEQKGFVHGYSRSICHGLALRRKENEFLVIRYPILLLIGGTVFLWILIDNVIEISDTNWFEKILNYNYCAGCLMFLYTLNNKQQKIRILSEALDQWWFYAFLQGDQERLKASIQRKTERFKHFYFQFMVGGSAGFCMMPLGRYLYESQKDSRNLLLFQCWSPFPLNTWWGFSITFCMEQISMMGLYFSWIFIVCYLFTVMWTIGYQMSVIGLSLVTVDKRTIGLLNGLKVRDEEGVRIYTRVMQHEIRSSAMHYQKLYGLAKEACDLFKAPINICYYSGMFAMVLSCGKLATERENKFVLLQSFFMFTNVLVSQYIVSYINQILADNAENLRVTVYDSPWYRMPKPCGTMIHIFQLMVRECPSITTVMGAKTNMEFFAMVVNTSYFYLGALLSMNIKY